MRTFGVVFGVLALAAIAQGTFSGLFGGQESMGGFASSGGGGGGGLGGIGEGIRRHFSNKFSGLSSSGSADASHSTYEAPVEVSYVSGLPDHSSYVEHSSGANYDHNSYSSYQPAMSYQPFISYQPAAAPAPVVEYTPHNTEFSSGSHDYGSSNQGFSQEYVNTNFVQSHPSPAYDHGAANAGFSGHSAGHQGYVY